MSSIEPERSGFGTTEEVHPSSIVIDKPLDDGKVGIQELRNAIPAYCFTPSYFWSFLTLGRDLTYSALLTYAFLKILEHTSEGPYSFLYYPLMMAYGAAQGIVWTGLWILAHECGHSAFSTSSFLNDLIGWTLHSWLLTPYFSWKSTHRRHHIYAGHIEKDLNYVPPRRDIYAAKIGIPPGQLDELTEDAPAVLFVRIIMQQLIGWNWYILSNITCPPEAVIKKGMSVWRYSHFDPWGALFRSSEVLAVLLSDIGCFLTITSLYYLTNYFGSFEKVFFFYIVPWTWVNHWIVMITYLHHTHQTIPKYTPEGWTFTLGATATIDRDFGIIGTHFFHHISSDHVTHHLFSKIPHYYSGTATKAIVPLLGNQYHERGRLSWQELRTSFTKCQWVEENPEMDKLLGNGEGGKGALWYRAGVSPLFEYRMRKAEQCEVDGKLADEKN